MGKRRQSPQRNIRRGCINNRKRVYSTLLILGSALILSLSFCPAVLMMSTSGRDEHHPDDVLVPTSRIDLDEEYENPEDARFTTSYIMEETPVPHTPTPQQQSSTDVPVPLLDISTISAPLLELFELLGDEDKLAVSLGIGSGNFGKGSAFSLENVNSSLNHQLGNLRQKLLHGLKEPSGEKKDNSSLLTPSSAGIFREDSLSHSEDDDELFLIPKKMLVDTFEAAEEKWLSTRKLLDDRFILTKGADAKGPIGTAFAFNAPNEESLALSNTSALLEIASRHFFKSLENSDKLEKRNKRSTTIIFQDEQVEPDESNLVGRSSSELDDFHTRFIRQSINSMSGPAATCGLSDESLPCDTQNKFRTFSGFCNNVRHPAWGKSVITFDRMVPSRYDDGIAVPRTRSVTGIALPSPRYVSSTVHIDVSHLSNRHTLMLMQYSQFVDHDITFTPVHKGPEGKILNCRDCDSAAQTHPECWPIGVPNGDSYYPQMNMESGRPHCIPFTRSLPGQQRLGPRDQINQNSAYLDSSQIYGESVCKAQSLRAPDGKLNFTGHPVHGAKPLMPQITFLKECKSPSGFCFYAGDPRASEQPALAAVHTIFLRAHNRWADGLKSINNHWDDNRVYQEARRIMIAANQHIIYSELLPRLVGNSMVNAYGLSLQNDGYYAGYDPNCPANIYNEFATAAFRFGHSLVRPNLARMDNRFNGMNPHISLRDGFFNSDMLYHPLMVDELIRGLLGEPMEQLDPFITKEITNHLFEDKKKQFSGMDLIALNLHRARDHGISGYNNYREVCGLRKAVTFQDLSGEIPSDVLGKMQETYPAVDDIDLFTGSISERPVSGGILGPTMTCIIATQFKRLRQCDRFWYETNDPQLRFSAQQLAELRKVTMSKLVCDNLDMSGEIQKQAFDAPHNVLNPKIPCDRLPQLSLEAWREAPPQAQSLTRIRQCNIGGKTVDVGASALPSPCVSCICTPEGTRCASLKITSCPKLFGEARKEDIVRDNICMSQCGFMLNNNNKFSQHPNSIFNVISRVARPLRRPA